ELHLGVAVGQAVDRLVLFEAVFFVRHPLDQLVQLRAQDERDIAHAEKPAALRAVDLFAAGVRHSVDDELPLAARALEDFRNHARAEFTLARIKSSGTLSVSGTREWHHRCFRGGHDMTLQSVNPATGEVVARYEETTPEAVRDILESVHEAFVEWRRLPFAERAAPMRRAAANLRGNAAEYARLMAREMGKPVKEGVAEAQKCATVCDFYAENAERFLSPEPIATEARRSFVAFNPLGVVLAVMPWNFPFWQVFRFAAPGLMAGNAAVLKHASNVPGCAMAIEQIFRRAGFPENLFRTLLISSRRVEGILEHPLVCAATLTGSGPAGRAVARKAGEMLKKTVLELGGSDPYLILEDADLELAAKVSAKGRLVNSGQSCIAAKRFIVVQKVRQHFEELFVEKMRAVKMGDPLNEDTEIGPQARHDLRDALHRQVEASIAAGARCLLGGKIPKDRG